MKQNTIRNLIRNIFCYHQEMWNEKKGYLRNLDRKKLLPVPNCGVKIKLIECLAKEGIF